MKKRRELDAMASRMKPIKNGSHELLRNVSFSSESEELLQTDRDNVSNCYVLSMLFHFVIIIIAIASVGGLIWMQLQLKEQVRDLKVQMVTFNTGELDAQNKMKELEAKSGEMAVQMKNMKASLGDLHITSAIENINKEIELLNSSQSRDIIIQLSKSVVSLSSHIEDLHEQVKKILVNQKSQVNQSLLEQDMKSVCHNVTQLQNTKLSLKIIKNQEFLQEVNDSISKLNQKILSLEVKLQQIDKNLKGNNGNSHVSPPIRYETKAKQEYILRKFFVSPLLKQEITTAKNNKVLTLNRTVTKSIDSKTYKKVVTENKDDAEASELTTS